ncbi:SDR family oxidoreductase [Phyllobacterium sp. LjRoot231]|uniref:SDR family NAD(P)-dependent oxidoreductase n=1 Tax=Phyllobacterium sp. LjRoot231 TaxID=3342289 RepID=UPI003ECE5CAF
MSEFAIYQRLRNKSVLISGGGSGIGAAHVMHFCAQGSRVAFIDYNREVSERLVEEVDAAGHCTPTYLQTDLRDVTDVQQKIADYVRKNGDIHILLNNAAHDERHAIDDVTVDYWDERIALNLRHLFFISQAVVPGMRRLKGGSIINFGSFSWRAGFGGMPIYVTAKAGIEGLTRGLARDLGVENIRVNCVIPGWIMTQRQLDLWVDEKAQVRIAEMQCLKEPLYPADIARMALWLAADDSRMCTSQTFVVDGGWS